jgi:hypothetical protein
MKIKLTEIVWDISGDDGDAENGPATPPELPTEVTVEVDDEEDAVDAASDKHGFCIKSAKTEVLPENTGDIDPILESFDDTWAD